MLGIVALALADKCIPGAASEEQWNNEAFRIRKCPPTDAIVLDMLASRSIEVAIEK